MSLFISALLSTLSLLVPSAVAAEWYAPDRVVSQYGGFIGYLSLGVEYNLNERYSTSMIGGYVPEAIGGEDLWSIAWKNNLNLTNDTPYVPYVGAGLVYSLDKDTYVTLPSQYPEGYYTPTAYYFIFYTGLNVQIEGRHSLYFELSTLDYYLEVKGRDLYRVSWQDICTWGIGYKVDLLSE